MQQQHFNWFTVHAAGPSGLSSSDNAKSLGTPPTTGTDTPNGTVYFECTVCKREVRYMDNQRNCCNLPLDFQIASNRYAPHLSGCMGLSNTRRGAARNANNKARSVVVCCDWRVLLISSQAVRNRPLSLPISRVREWLHLG